jgi:succinyl-CoA ligase-like protein
LTTPEIKRLLAALPAGSARPDTQNATWPGLGADARARGKHVIAAKVGGTESGKRASLAHTAHDPGDEAEFARALADGGIPVAADQEELVDLAMAFSRTKTPAGRRIGIAPVLRLVADSGEVDARALAALMNPSAI